MVGNLEIKIVKLVKQIKPKLSQYCEKEDLENIIYYLLQVIEEIVTSEMQESAPNEKMIDTIETRLRKLNKMI